MSRLLAVIANDPQRIRCVLHPGRSLLVDDGQRPLDGWGVGFYQGGEVLLQRRPRPPAGPVDFYETVREIHTDALIGHMRRGTVGAAKNENTHPFRFRSWLFAHHGTVFGTGAGFEENRAALDDALPDFLRRNIRGQTDSEYLFHLFLAQLHAAGKLDDALIATQVAVKALAETFALIDQIANKGTPTASPSTLDVAATNGRILLVARRGLPVHYYEVNGVRDCPVCRESPVDATRPNRAVDHEHLRGVVVIADGDTDLPRGPLWHELPENHAIAVSHELQIQILPLAPAAV